MSSVELSVGRLAIGLATLAAACAPAKARVEVSGQHVPRENRKPRYKRVDHWVFSDLARPLSQAEAQLKVRFERAFPNAQFSQPLTCLAREHGAFMSKYGAFADEVLERNMDGRCGAASVGLISTRIYPNDGTVLDAPLSDELLADIAKRLPQDSGAFTAFGITALYDGPNMLVVLDTASPTATMEVTEADEARAVRVTGEVFGDLSDVSASITQGELGVADCEVKSESAWPKYAFTCTMAPGDEEAWVALSVEAEAGLERLPMLPAHAQGWSPPADYQRKHLSLPASVDTRRAIASALNSFRAELGVAPVEYAAEQSHAIESPYAEVFRLDATRDAERDRALRKLMERGDHVGGADPVAYGWTLDGIALDGGPADWLMARLLEPLSREGLMSETFSQLAIATDGDPDLGFGAAAVFYQLLTPERENGLADELTKAVATSRQRRKTHRLPNPPEIDAAAAAIAGGASPSKAMEAALLRVNIGSRKTAPLGAVLLIFDDTVSDFAVPKQLPDVLLEPQILEYGISVTHSIDPRHGWARPLAIIWFRMEASALPQALADDVTPSSHRFGTKSRSAATRRPARW